MLGFTQFGVGALVAPLVGLFGSTTSVPMGAVMLAVTGLAGRTHVRGRAPGPVRARARLDAGLPLRRAVVWQTVWLVPVHVRYSTRATRRLHRERKP